LRGSGNADAAIGDLQDRNAVAGLDQDFNSTAAWNLVTNIPVIVAGTNYVTNAISTTATFYRLTSAAPPPTLTAMLTGANIVLLWPTNV
jgi:hypothetical protein